MDAGAKGLSSGAAVPVKTPKVKAVVYPKTPNVNCGWLIGVSGASPKIDAGVMGDSSARVEY